MADPKYANLPGLDIDQPDVYETDDRPEEDQYEEVDYGDQSDVVETLHMTASEAFGKFKSKNLDTSNVDFSDAIRKSKKHGYIAWSGDYEVVGEGCRDEAETILQRYQRLNCEVRELLDEVEQAKESGKTESLPCVGKPGQSLSAISMQASQLQDTLANLRLEETLGSELIKRLDDPSGATKERLLLQLEALKNVSAKGDAKHTSASSNAPPASGTFTYELLMKPETSTLEEQRRIAELDKRLEDLEKLVSYSPDKMSDLSMETNQKSVTGAIEVLSGKLSLLNPSHLDHVEGRLAALLQKMNTVSEKKVIIEDAEKQNKISELYDLLMKTEANSVVLPEIVERLESLQTLHEQASQFSKAMTQLDTVQQKLESNLGGNHKLLQDTQAKFAENLTNIQKNFENIDQRLNALK